MHTVPKQTSYLCFLFASVLTHYILILHSFGYYIAQSWGVLLYENLHVLNVLTKGTLADTLTNREWRLVLALMVRESYKVLVNTRTYVHIIFASCE